MTGPRAARRPASLAACAAALALLAAGCAAAGEGVPADAAASSAGPASASAEAAPAAFARLKGLSGSWSAPAPGGQGSMKVTYRVVSGGSAVEEDLLPGTPHEMISMYHLDGTRLLMTHYCAAGNQPTMVLVPGDDPAVLRFEFLRGTNMRDANDGHMHSLVLEIPSADRARASWTYWEGGKAGESKEFDLSREK